VLLSSILLLHSWEQNGEYFDAKNDFWRAKSNLTKPSRRNQWRLANEGVQSHSLGTLCKTG
jgi:hypothetical protein